MLSCRGIRGNNWLSCPWRQSSQRGCNENWLSQGYDSWKYYPLKRYLYIVGCSIYIKRILWTEPGTRIQLGLLVRTSLKTVASSVSLSVTNEGNALCQRGEMEICRATDTARNRCSWRLVCVTCVWTSTQIESSTAFCPRMFSPSHPSRVIARRRVHVDDAFVFMLNSRSAR